MSAHRVASLFRHSLATTSTLHQVSCRHVRNVVATRKTGTTENGTVTASTSEHDKTSTASGMF
jgi:hypothetical protein